MSVKADLVSLQHVKAQQHVHRLIFQNGEGTREEVPFNLYLSWSIQENKIKNKLMHTQEKKRMIECSIQNSILKMFLLTKL